MFPILTAAVVPFVQLPPDGVVDAPVQQPPDGAFVEAVERAYARGGSQPHARTASPDGAGGTDGLTDPNAGAWAAGLNFQPGRLTLEQEPSSPDAAEGPVGMILRNMAGSLSSAAAGNTAFPLIQAGRAEFPRCEISQAGFAGTAHSLRMAGLSNQASNMTAAGGEAVQAASGRAGAIGQSAGSAGSAGGMIAAGSSMEGPAGAVPMDTVKGATPVPAASVKAALTIAAQAASAGAAAVRAAMAGALDQAEANSASFPAERPAVLEILSAVRQPGNGAVNDSAVASAPETGGAEEPAIPGYGAGVAQTRAARTAAKAKAAPVQRAADALQAGAAGLQAESVWTANARTEAAPSQQPNVKTDAVQGMSARTETVAALQTNTLPEAVQGMSARTEATAALRTGTRSEMATAQHTSARTEATAALRTGTRSEMATAQHTSARTEATAALRTGTRSETATAQHTGARLETATANEIDALSEGDAAAAGSRPETKPSDALPLPEKTAATQANAQPFTAAGGSNTPQGMTAAQAANTQPDAAAATLSATGIAGTAAAPAKTGTAPEPLAAVRGTARKGTDTARAVSAQPQDSAAQEAGLSTRTQAAARQENAYKGQALKPEPDAERDQDAARSRPVGGAAAGRAGGNSDGRGGSGIAASGAGSGPGPGRWPEGILRSWPVGAAGQGRPGCSAQGRNPVPPETPPGGRGRGGGHDQRERP